MIEMASLCHQTLEKAEHSRSIDMYHELRNTLQTLKDNNIGGLLPSLIISEMINNSFVRNDTAAVFTHLMDFRNYSYDMLCRDISRPINYGMLDASSNSWYGESYLSMNLYRNQTLMLLTWFPYSASIQLAYEALLHTKNLRLSANNFFKFMADESEDIAMQKLYNRLSLLQTTYQELDAEYNSNWLKYRNEFDTDLADYPKLKIIKDDISAIKDSIFSIADNNSLYINKFFTQWTAIKNQLSEHDIAIEFAKVPLYTGQAQYIALIIDHTNEHPVYLNLCNEEQLRNIDATKNEGLNKLNELIWKPIEECFTGKRKIYFSADGLLHMLPIEYALSNTSVYRLSSTREIIKVRPFIDNVNFIGFGGLDYNTYDTISIPKKWVTRGMSTSDVTRGTRGYLQGTLIEVNNLARLINKKTGASASIHSGAMGSEESFYQLEDSEFNMLHIATHGFYYTQDEVEQKKNNRSKYAFIDFEDGDIDRELTHSGLLLSGANRTLSGLPVPQGYEDGILTAKEIAETNLSHLNMVVLSACQTGLGEISSEGVAGLQRGFKSAGVKSLLMSLWEVDDRATTLLMTQFYTNLLSGMSKKDSLIEAQRSVKSLPRYQAPEYWAGFILLDAFD